MSFLAQNGRRGDNGSVSSTDGQTWDIVVVGAGAAGAVIAARALPEGLLKLLQAIHPLL